MKFKNFVYYASLMLTLFAAATLTVYAGAAKEEKASIERLAQVTAANAEAKTSGVISDEIIVNATNYLTLTACENIDDIPEMREELAPVERVTEPVFESSASADESVAAVSTGNTMLNVSDYDVYLLACQIYVEAGDEPYDCMVGVGNVIINRVLSYEFANSISGVIYEAGQFPPAYNGVLDSVLANGPGSTCMQAAVDALNGYSTVGGYLYFNMSCGVDTSSCSSYMQIGDTIFYMP